MYRFLKLPVLCVAAGIVSACNSEPSVVTTPDIPTAGVRFVHAVPDTGALDARFVDMPENSAHFGVVFRGNIVTASAVPASTQIFYRNTRAGERHLRIFLSSTNQAIAQTVLKDTVITFEAGRRYTLLLWGYANPTGPGRPAGAPAMRLTVIDETEPDPSPNVALRVINTSLTPLDVRYFKEGTAIPAAASWSGVAAAPNGISTYVTTAPDTLRFNVRTAGTATNFVATDARALRGEQHVLGPPGPIEGTPGTTVAGSALTALIFPPSVAGTAAAQFTSPAISFVWDRRPPRPPGM